ncbi:MAG: Gfo/Idh/MocA family oxidoreductase [Tetrasphaera sp.]
MKVGLAGVGRIGAIHAATLATIDGVDGLVLADVDAAAARRVADELGLDAVADPEALVAAGIDALVIATATPGHAPLLRRGLISGIPTFCEKPVAASLAETLELAALEESSHTPAQIGFQRRFDTGYQRARAAVASGELGTLHAVRATTHDQAPPPAAYIRASGGIFADCNIHDFDIIRFVTGREATAVFATGENKGDPVFTQEGDVDTAAAIITMDDGTLVTVTSTRYNGAGHDIRMELTGSAGAVAVGLDHSLALRSLEDDVDFPTGPQCWSFLERFREAYVKELQAFIDVAAGRAASACTVRDALEATRIAQACDLSRRERRLVDLSEIPGVS